MCVKIKMKKRRFSNADDHLVGWDNEQNNEILQFWFKDWLWRIGRCIAHDGKYLKQLFQKAPL